MMLLARRKKCHVTSIQFAASRVKTTEARRGNRMPRAPGWNQRRGSSEQSAPDRLITPDVNTLHLLRFKECQCPDAFEQLYRYYFPRVRAFLCQRGANPRDAQDLAQEAMVRVWKKAGQFDPSRANASTWIFTISRNLSVDALRQQKRYEVHADDPLLVTADVESPESDVIKLDEGKRIASAISALPAEQALVIQLRYVDGLKQREIADELDLPLNTVKSRIRLAVARLRRTLETQ